MLVQSPVKVFVVDDSAFMRRMITAMLESDPQIKVIGYAREGREALEKIRRLRPDVITLDVEMPGMGGLETLKALMDTQPLPVVMLSAVTTAGAQITLRALELGAVDFVPKPEKRADIMLLAEELRAKVKLAAGVPVDRIERQRALCGGRPCPKEEAAAPSPVSRPSLQDRKQLSMVAIGTSTGGPAALAEVFKSLPAGLDAAVIVAQHMPPGFTRSLANRLNDLGNLPVKEAADGDAVEKGQALIAPAGFQTEVEERNGQVRVRVSEKTDYQTLFRPSVDVLFLSVARVYGPSALGVIMTGMGSDGTKGLKAIKEASGYVIAQDEASCIVYGMPKSAVEAGVVDKVVPLTKIGEEITNLVGVTK